MPEEMAAAFWLGAAAYAVLGVLLWLALSLGAMKRLDAAAATAPWRVKAVLAPGLIALWPIVLALLLKPQRGAL